MPSNPIRQAQALAIQRLTEILRTSDDPVQVRLTSELLLRLTPEEPAAAAPTQPTVSSEPAPAPPAPATSALSHEELAALRHLLPSVRPERFAKRPAHWRAILTQYGRSPPRSASAAA